MRNCRRYLGEAAEVYAHEVNSLLLTAETVVADCGDAPVLFSVDGGHTAELAFNDLAIAAAVTADDGVVILDDFYNEAWPEVAFGALRFFFEQPNALYPFCVVGNKVLLARNPELADRLAAYLISRPAGSFPGVYYVGECELLGRRVCQMRVAGGLRLVLGRIVHTRAWQAFQMTALGQAVRRAFGR